METMQIEIVIGSIAKETTYIIKTFEFPYSIGSQDLI